PRGANPALGRAAFDECPLKLTEASVLIGQPLDGDHRRSGRLAGWHEAGINHPSVEKNGARAALALAATLLGAGEREVLAKHIEEALEWRPLGAWRLPVQGERELQLDRSSAPRSRSGVMGSSSTRVPVAWRIAAATAGAGPSIGSSPTPLAP